jgi:hypothetical protein
VGRWDDLGEVARPEATDAGTEHSDRFKVKLETWTNDLCAWDKWRTYVLASTRAGFLPGRPAQACRGRRRFGILRPV